MHHLCSLLLASSLILPGTAYAAADPTPTAPSEHRLSPAEIEQVLDTAARKREAAESRPWAAELNEDELPPPIHGEVGFSIGTDGYRSAFGTAIVPLSDDGLAILSFETDQFRSRRFNHRAW